MARRGSRDAGSTRVFRTRAGPPRIAEVHFRHLWAGLLEDTWLSAGPAATSNVLGAVEALSGSRCPSIRFSGWSRCSNTCRQDSRNVNRQVQVGTLMQGNLAELSRS